MAGFALSPRRDIFPSLQGGTLQGVSLPPGEWGVGVGGRGKGALASDAAVAAREVGQAGLSELTTVRVWVIRT
jgi:hypothetical protein